MIHPQAASVLQALEEEAGDPQDLAAARAGYFKTALRFGGTPQEVARVEECLAKEVRVRVYHPRKQEVDGAIVYAHGGGWVIGDLDGIDHVCRALCNRAGAVVVSVDYRLAPEHPFPDAPDDVLTGLLWALERYPRVAIAGDSAGGNLAAAVAITRRARLAAMLLVYPAMDPTCSSRSYQQPYPGLTREQMQACWAAYLGGADPDNPEVCPLGAELEGMPPTFVAVAGQDVLRDDGVAFAASLDDADVDVELAVYEDMPHGFLRWGGVVDRAGELIRDMGDYARVLLAE